MLHLRYRSFSCALGALSILIASNAVAQSPDTAATLSNEASENSSNDERPSPLVDKVRDATRRFQNINVAMDDGYVQGTPCVSGPEFGAMGVHFILPPLVGDGDVDATQPEALIYEPLGDGRWRLVGAEFIVLAEDWNTQHPDDPPSLDGHLMNLVGEPNRYRLPAFYEIHVWAWRNNPKGHFADFNPRVTCNLQPAP